MFPLPRVFKQFNENDPVGESKTIVLIEEDINNLMGLFTDGVETTILELEKDGVTTRVKDTEDGVFQEITGDLIPQEFTHRAYIRTSVDDETEVMTMLNHFTIFSVITNRVRAMPISMQAHSALEDYIDNDERLKFNDHTVGLWHAAAANLSNVETAESGEVIAVAVDLMGYLFLDRLTGPLNMDIDDLRSMDSENVGELFSVFPQHHDEDEPLGLGVRMNLTTNDFINTTDDDEEETPSIITH